MLFFTSGRTRTLRRSRHDPSSWLPADTSVDPEQAMKDAGTAVRRAGEDIAEAARQISVEAVRQIRFNTAAASADAKRQIRANAKATRAEARRQIRNNVRAVRANASAVPDDLLPAGRNAIRKSVDRLVPGRRKRARRGRLLGVLGMFMTAGLTLLGVQMLMARRSSRSMRRKDWGHSPGGRTPAAVGAGGMTGAETLGSAGGARTPGAGASVGADSTPGAPGLSAAATTGLPKPTGLPNAVSPSDQGGSAGRHPPADLPPDASTEAGTFDRDAGIRAASEGMEPPEPLVPGAPPSETADEM